MTLYFWTVIDSHMLGLMRRDKRLNIIRELDLLDSVRKILGWTTSSSSYSINYPMRAHDKK